MFSATQSSLQCQVRRHLSSAPIELAIFTSAVAFAAFLHTAGWLTSEGAGGITAGLLLAIIIRAWGAFDGGRHPAFLFLCSLALFQAGRLFGYCLGLSEHPLRVDLMTPIPFYPS